VHLQKAEVKDSEASTDSFECPSRPAGMAAPSEVDDAMRERQWRDPEEWTMTMQEWLDVIEHIMAQPQYAATKRQKRNVTMYDINELFVKPWTRGTGCGLAVMMSKHRRQKPKKMFSHAWGEDVKECYDALLRYFKRNKISLDEPIWFCVFANYQCQDGFGPSIPDQIALQPFAKVIESPGLDGMVAIHTTMEDLYRRLWCVHEVDKAIESQVEVSAAMSHQYEEELLRRVKFFMDKGFGHKDCLKAAGINVATINAKCGFPPDEGMLVDIIRQREGGFHKLDEVIHKFRMQVLPDKVAAALAEKDKQEKAEKDAEKDDLDNREVLNLLLSQDESVRASGLHQLGTLRRALSGVLEAVTHLDLSNTPLHMLPEAVGSLKALQTLDLHRHTQFKSLPSGFSKLVNLTFKSFMACIKVAQSLPECIMAHPPIRDATSLDLSNAKLERLPESKHTLEWPV